MYQRGRRHMEVLSASRVSRVCPWHQEIFQAWIGGEGTPNLEDIFIGRQYWNLPRCQFPIPPAKFDRLYGISGTYLCNPLLQLHQSCGGQKYVLGRFNKSDNGRMWSRFTGLANYIRVQKEVYFHSATFLLRRLIILPILLRPIVRTDY